MAHLLEREDTLDHAEMDELWDYLRGGHVSAPARRRPNHCVECSGYVLSDDVRGYDVCSGCGVVQPDSQHFVSEFVDTERCSPPREGYKPIHHFHERLAQYHILETSIGWEHWLRICTALRGTASLDKEHLRHVLRPLGLQRYNENWLQIIHRLTGYQPPSLSSEECETLDTMFTAVHEPFRHLKHGQRKNLPNYNFLFARLLQLIGRPELCCHFPQLKTRAKWLEIDRVWKGICEYHDWQYLPEPRFEPLRVDLDQQQLERQIAVAAEMAKRLREHKETQRERRRRVHTAGNSRLLDRMDRVSAIATQKSALERDGRAAMRAKRRVVRRARRASAARS